MPSPITTTLLAAAGVRNPDHWTAPLNAACAAHAITTPLRLAGFLATVLHESMGLARVVESLDYAPPGLMATWPRRFNPADAARMGRTVQHPADQRAIAERAYGGRMGNGPEGAGDGWLCRGRGPMQVTGLDAYKRVAATAGMPVSAVASYLESAEGGSMEAARYWQSHGCNEMADRSDVRAFRAAVNGGLIGLDDVMTRWTLLRGLLAPGQQQLHARPAPVLASMAPVPPLQQSSADDSAVTATLNDASLAAAQA